MAALFVDSSNFFIRSFFSSAVGGSSENPDWDLWRFLIIDHLLIYINKFSAKELILATDTPKYWRKMIFPGYKAGRKKGRDESSVDWNSYFENYHEYLEEIKTHLPFKVLQIENCESDDIIGVLYKKLIPAIILSTDVDFAQCVNDYVRVFNAFKGEFIEPRENFIDYYSLLGMKKDEIPNVLTPLDWESGKRKPPMGEAKANKILNYGLEKWLKEQNLEKRFEQNKKLIDFDLIPQTIVNRIMNTYSAYKLPDPENITKFVYKNNWKTHVERISDIENRLLQLYN
jgi:5'-3' exonuclease